MVVKCPKCNKLLEVPKEKLGKKEVCEHCENIFVVDESVIYKGFTSELQESTVRTVEHKIVETKVAAPGETVFYTDANGVRITNTRAIFGNTTYSMSNITSVSKGFVPPNRKPGYIIAMIGLLLLIICAGVDNNPGAITGGLLIALGVVIAFIAKPTYTVRIGSASGETSALRSKNEKYIQSVVDAMNEAIVKRG